ncbi:uncharacterized protein BYT42DRAFT_627285 [Radiomyces spectabilis]|uniref:uncharacterized protein n=1 Tax=Radiomyces spectabilis TaxID=64574 RepID=UPI00221FFBAA|nr:uncharacterized protein BYT42DRAFT_627285 [Radiomyces spectabilis]KAI8365338.1 hypothetical protein BYT42DRAFT_627285 [Radiomyces spectabilis]
MASVHQPPMLTTWSFGKSPMASPPYEAASHRSPTEGQCDNFNLASINSCGSGKCTCDKCSVKRQWETASPPTSTLPLRRSRSIGADLNTSRRLSSGSACETCRRRKTKCDGGQPCAFCISKGIECVHRAPSRRKRSPAFASANTSPTNETYTGAGIEIHHDRPSLMKQASCPSFMNARYSTITPPWTPPYQPYTKRTSIDRSKWQIPSIMDQLSCHTFSATVMAAGMTDHYPLAGSFQRIHHVQPLTPMSD